MKKYMKLLMPVAIFVGALVVLVILFAARPQAQKHLLEIKEPLVSVLPVDSQDLRIPIFTRGTVTPGTEIPLVSEVSGPVTYVSENFARGGFFKKGEILIKVDPVEYEVTRKKADAAVAQAFQILKQAEAERKVRGQVQGMGMQNSGLGNFTYQYQQAQAQYDAAKAELDAVLLQEKKTVIMAPFDGRVRMGGVNSGQYLRPGIQLGLIYAVNAAEVRLPLADKQLSLVDVPFRFGTDGSEGPKVTLVGDFGGRKFTWTGQVVRSESGVDEFNRLLYVIAQIPDPYAIDPTQPDRPPLTAGNFVEAQIEGKPYQNVFVVPRRALRNGSQVWTVNASQRLQRRDVEILHKGRDVVYVKSGLEKGDNVVLTQLDVAVDGMKVRSHVESEPPKGDDVGKPANLLGEPASDEKTTSSASEPAQDAHAEGAAKLTVSPDVAGKLQDVKQRWDKASPEEKAKALKQATDAIGAVSGQIQRAASQASALQANPVALEQLAAKVNDAAKGHDPELGAKLEKLKEAAAPKSSASEKSAAHVSKPQGAATASPTSTKPASNKVNASSPAVSPLADVIEQTEKSMQGVASDTGNGKAPAAAESLLTPQSGSVAPISVPRVLMESSQ